MEPQVTANKWQIIVKFSLIYALITIALNLILYILDMQSKMDVFSTIALIVITLGSVYFGILSRRDNVMDGFITYGQGVSTGMLISLVAALIVSVIPLFLQLLSTLILCKISSIKLSAI
jgi:hypothetical protein